MEEDRRRGGAAGPEHEVGAVTSDPDHLSSHTAYSHSTFPQQACLLEKSTPQKVGTLPLEAVVAKKEKYIS